MSRLGRGFPNNALMQIPYSRPGVLWDSTGAGNGGNAVSGVNWLQTIGAAANLLVVGANWISTGYNPVCTVGGVSMTRIGNAAYTNTGGGGYTSALSIFYLFNPPTGSQTIAFSSSSGGTAYCSANSASYLNAGSVGSISNNSAASITVSSAPRQRVFNIMGGWSSASPQGFTSYNQNTLWTAPSADEPAIIGDAPGASSITFSATNNAVNGCGSMVLPILPH